MTGTVDIFLTEAISSTTNHTAGEDFTTETAIFIASALETKWVSVPLPLLTDINISGHCFSRIPIRICNAMEEAP